MSGESPPEIEARTPVPVPRPSQLGRETKRIRAACQSTKKRKYRAILIWLTSCLSLVARDQNLDYRR